MWGQRPGQAGISVFCSDTNRVNPVLFYAAKVFHRVFHNVGISMWAGFFGGLYFCGYICEMAGGVGIAGFSLFVNRCSQG